jgi:hypothetical protein
MRLVPCVALVLAILPAACTPFWEGSASRSAGKSPVVRIAVHVSPKDPAHPTVPMPVVFTIDDDEHAGIDLIATQPGKARLSRDEP